MSDGCRSSLVQELFELHLDCISGMERSSEVVSDLSTLADLSTIWSPNFTSLEHRIALSPMVQTSVALKQLSALFLS